MNNSVFGKTIENIRKRIDIKLVNQEKQRTKLVGQPNFMRMEIFTTPVQEKKLLFCLPSRSMVGI